MKEEGKGKMKDYILFLTKFEYIFDSLIKSLQTINI